MSFERRVYVVLPAYNEQKSLRELLPEIVRSLRSETALFTICVVDDGSTDQTPALLEELKGSVPLQVLRHDINQGYGAALRTGITWVIEHADPEEALVTMDADRTHIPVYIPNLLQKLNEGYEVVTASYWAPGAAFHGVPFKRRLMSRVVNLLMRLRFRIRGAETYTNGFRAYRVGALQAAAKISTGSLIQQTDFAGGTELFLKVARSGAKAGEVPFTLYYDRRGAGSKIHILPTILGYLRLLAG